MQSVSVFVMNKLVVDVQCIAACVLVYKLCLFIYDVHTIIGLMQLKQVSTLHSKHTRVSVGIATHICCVHIYGNEI